MDEDESLINLGNIIGANETIADGLPKRNIITDNL